MTRYGIIALSVLSLLATACGGRAEESPPTPTAIPLMTESKADDAEPNASDDGATDDEAADDEEAPAEIAVDEPSESAAAGNGGQQRGMGRRMMGGGMGSEMRERHMASIPAEYAGLTSSVAADAESVARGKAHFDQFCASCHGNEGLGDGPAAASLDPAPPMIAQTSLMLGDDHLFWRISEGGAFEPFNSAMPPWKEILDEEARWDIINYARTFGGMGGGRGDGSMREEMQAAMHDDMLAAGIEQGVIDATEAEAFLAVHDQLDAYRATVEESMTGNMDEMQAQLLADMVDAGQLSQGGADAFSDIHARLSDAGLMP